MLNSQNPHIYYTDNSIVYKHIPNNNNDEQERERQKKPSPVFWKYILQCPATVNASETGVCTTISHKPIPTRPTLRNGIFILVWK